MVGGPFSRRTQTGEINKHMPYELIDDDTHLQIQNEGADLKEVGGFGNIMDVLRPATPPVPKNARIVRQLDVEAARTEAQRVAEGAPATRAQPGRRATRSEKRALRNRSLFAAAGLNLD